MDDGAMPRTRGEKIARARMPKAARREILMALTRR